MVVPFAADNLHDHDPARHRRRQRADQAGEKAQPDDPALAVEIIALGPEMQQQPRDEPGFENIDQPQREGPFMAEAEQACRQRAQHDQHRGCHEVA